MDIIEEDMNNKYNAAFTSDKDKFDFQRFFLNNFIYTDINEVEKSIEIEDNKELFTPPSNTDDTISVRKLKIALLNNNSPLVQIRNFIQIEYNYLTVETIGNDYDVSIFPTDFKLNITNNENTNIFSWKFSWKYKYKPTHTFSYLWMIFFIIRK